MSTFLDLFGALMDEQFGNRARFSELSGASTAYLTAITKGRQLPRPKALDEWLEKAGVSREKRERLVFLLRLEKLKADEDLAPLVGYFDERIAGLTEALRVMSEMCGKAGVKLPSDLIQRIELAKLA